MELKKLAPWNWFKKEEEDGRQSIPPVHRIENTRTAHPVYGDRLEIDRLFDEFFRGFGFPSMGFGRAFPSLAQSEWLKPTVDIAATEKEYTIAVEIPGVEEKDFNLELSDGTLRIRGEKRQQREEKESNYYRMERSFGSFQRVVSLPEDVEEEGITARYTKGVLTIRLPRKSRPQAEWRKIPVSSGKDSGRQAQLTA